MPFDAAEWPPRESPPKRVLTFWDLWIMPLRIWLMMMGHAI